MMKYKSLVLAVSALLFTVSCSQKELTPEEAASQAAQEYYDRLIAGDYEAFLAGRIATDSLPDDYRRQLLNGYRLYHAELQKTHGGITGVTVSNAHRDSSQNLMQTFLLLSFNDSTQEEIIVPMVQNDNGEWKMR